MYQNELQHYGVKGMKWGHRKARPITVRQGMRNAKNAGQDAWRKATVEQGGKLIGGKNSSIAKYPSAKARRAGSKVAKAAYKDAAKQSAKNDKAYNKQLRAEKKANMTPEEKAARRKKAIKIGAAAAGTALAAYGTYKVVQAVQNKKAMERGRIAAEKAAKRYQREAKDLVERAEQLRKAGSIHGRVQSGGNIIEW